MICHITHTSVSPQLNNNLQIIDVTLQNQKAVNAYFTSQGLSPFGFALRHYNLPTGLSESPMSW